MMSQKVAIDNVISVCVDCEMILEFRPDALNTPSVMSFEVTTDMVGKTVSLFLDRRPRAEMTPEEIYKKYTITFTKFSDEISASDGGKCSKI